MGLTSKDFKQLVNEAIERGQGIEVEELDIDEEIVLQSTDDMDKEAEAALNLADTRRFIDLHRGKL